MIISPNGWKHLHFQTIKQSLSLIPWSLRYFFALGSLDIFILIRHQNLWENWWLSFLFSWRYNAHEPVPTDHSQMALWNDLIGLWSICSPNFVTRIAMTGINTSHSSCVHIGLLPMHQQDVHQTWWCLVVKHTCPLILCFLLLDIVVTGAITSMCKGWNASSRTIMRWQDNSWTLQLRGKNVTMMPAPKTANTRRVTLSSDLMPQIWRTNWTLPTLVRSASWHVLGGEL